MTKKETNSDNYQDEGHKQPEDETSEEVSDEEIEYEEFQKGN